ncbi:MAG TPA: glycosyltransferase [Phycisphaerae bacterium]|nr:glycosyltransferase [Phycisphaerae bacterium]
MWFLLFLYVLALLIYARQVRDSGKVIHREVGLDDEPMGGAIPSVTVVVPFKDEGPLIASCLESVLKQDYPNLHVLAVNDRSGDGGGDVVRRLCESYPALRLREIEELPGDMFGKPHALHAATEGIDSDYIVFLDSDFRMAPGCVRALVRQFLKQDVDWLAVMARPDLTTAWERMLVPMFGAMVYAWRDPAKIADPASDDALGSGFMIVRREAYEAIGRHESVVRSYDEDSELLRVAKRANQRVAYIMAPRIASVRFYGGFGALVRGLTRTLIGGLKSLWQFALTIIGVQFVSLTPIGVMIGVGIAVAMGATGLLTGLFTALALVHIGMSIYLGVSVYRISGVHAVYCFLQPIAACVMTVIVIRAAILRMRKRSVSWRGTRYESTAVVRSPEAVS